MTVAPRDQGAIDGRVRDVVPGGDAVIETERGLVFARGALPGERVRLRVEGRRGGALHGRVLALLEPSHDRVAAPCPIVERCGGCPLMVLADSAEANFKRARLQRVLEQRGYAAEPEWYPSPRPLGYRTRARLAWARARAGGARIGYRAARSRALVDTERCAVLDPELERGLHALRAALGPLLAGEGEVMLGLGAGGRCVVELSSDVAQPEAVYAAARALVERGELCGVALRAGGRDLPPARFGDPRQLVRGADGGPLWVPEGGFTQANPEVNARLVTRVAELAEPAGARVLELFAGCGNLSVALAPRAAELVAVESDRAAAEACRENLAARNLRQARVVCEDAARAASRGGPRDVVVLDPPRRGARDALAGIAARRPQRIVYVSCDTTTLRRDLGELSALGYRVDAAAAFDMFPQTAHLESVVRLVPVRPQRAH